MPIWDQVFAFVTGLVFLVIGWFLGKHLETHKQLAARSTAEHLLDEAEKTAKKLLSEAELEAKKMSAEAERASESLKSSALAEAERLKDNANTEAEKLKLAAEREVENLKKEKILDARERIAQLEEQSKKEAEAAIAELKKRESSISRREDDLKNSEARLNDFERQLSAKEMRLDEREDKLSGSEASLEERLKELRNSENILRESLERQSGMTSEEALAELLRRVEAENSLMLNRRIRQAEQIAKEEADSRARRIITLAIQKWASPQVVESTLSTVDLPSEEMKGRIIGREGRNIRNIEKLTGVDLIIDDTPGAVLISCFDPIRREIARVALEKLVADGRIQPTKIEEMVAASHREVDEIIAQKGDQAAMEAGVSGLDKELITYLGRLHFRTSYGQNMLRHSLEVSFLAARMAAEIGADVQIAARAGLLHDIGKAVTADVEGPHAVIGGRLCENFGESSAVVHCVEAHHEDVEQRTVEAMIVQAADAISAARPGARREDVENYIKRLENLEKIAYSFEGVEQVYAIQAGREVRVFVNPKIIDDYKANILANQIASRIEDESQYPGIIVVTVVRESRKTAVAQ
ncbi:ribonuclease Y [bacterium]|nr:ribonuclease Y [bacterium]